MTTDDLWVIPLDEQVARLMAGCEFGDVQLERAMRERLRGRLASAQQEGRPLRVYAGYDASAPDLHIGHSITLRKLRQFQEFGHDVTVVIGTVTAMIGDTSDRATGRPRRSSEDVEAAATAYSQQVALILDVSRTTIVKNSDWLGVMRLPEILELASEFTVQQFLARDNYRRRIDRGEPVGLHEFFYALLQGYDAVNLRADVQLGATEQLFNILAGAKLQEVSGQKPCVALTFPVLVGTDGVERMSKSRGNYIGLAEPPEEQFGKVMSISDETMLEWVGLITDWTRTEVAQFRNDVVRGDVHPMDAKKRLAGHVVEMYHGSHASRAAQQQFEAVHQLGRAPEGIPEVVIEDSIGIVDLLVLLRAAGSKSAARRLVTGGAVAVDETRVTSLDHVVTPPARIKVGSRRFYRVVAR